MDGALAFAPELARENAGYDPERFCQMPDIDDEHFLRRARNRLFSWALSRYFPGSSRFLEIGSGIGVVLKALRADNPTLELWGSEIYASGLDVIRQNVSDAHVFQADACRLPFDAEFDAIGAFDVLEHIEDDREVLRQLYRALVPGGGLLLSVPQHPFLWSQRDEYVCHKRRYTRRELLDKIRDAGFETIRVTSFVSLVFPLMAWAALSSRRPRADYDPFSEFKIGPVRSGILTAAFDLERLLIKAGISFPFGGTLFVVAQKPQEPVG